MAINKGVRVATLAEENKTNIAKSIESITNSRNTIRNKLIDFGLAQNNDQLAALATAISNITDNGSVQASVREGETYNIPKGYHDGSGTVSGVSGGGNYNLQSKTVTPTKAQQPITADEGYYGLSDVTVKAIPEAYQDVTAVTATATDVLATKIIVDATGKVTTGTMPNNGAAEKTLTTTETSYTIPEGYHNGEGTVIIVPETKTVQPSRSEQNVTPTAGKVLSKVTVGAIPANLIDTTDANAETSHILITKSAYVNGKKVDGTMPNNETITGTIDGLTETSYTIPAGYTAGGTVTLTDDIEQALAAI